MVNRQLSRLSLRCRVMLIVFAVITLPVELRVHATFAREYYDLYVKNLQLMALTAVKRGAEYLPADPRAAVRVADSYVQSQGIASAEIVFTELSSDNNMLTIGLDRKIPQFVAVLALGVLPARHINVTASAWRQGAGQPFGIKIIYVTAAQSSRPEPRKIRVPSPAAFEKRNARSERSNWTARERRIQFPDPFGKNPASALVGAEIAATNLPRKPL